MRNVRINRVYYAAIVSIIALGVGVNFGFTSHFKKKSTSVLLEFSHYAGESLLQLDSAHYKNALGQDFTISMFKYYVGDFELISTSGKRVKSEGYFLIDEENEHSKSFALENVPIDEYVAINFIIGVDSAHNCSGAQSGALDPLNAMFWSWNTGYIFLKLEGNSEKCTTPSRFFEYHIGGYKSTENCIRQIALPMKPFNVTKDQRNSIGIEVDVLKVLGQTNPMDFEQIPVVTNHNYATLVADNYAKMFRISGNE